MPWHRFPMPWQCRVPDVKKPTRWWAVVVQSGGIAACAAAKFFEAVLPVKTWCCAARSDFLRFFWPRCHFPPISPYLLPQTRGRETQAVQPRFAIGNTHLRGSRRSPLVFADHLWVTQCGRAFGRYRTALDTAWAACSITRSVCAPSRRCYIPCGHSYGVDLGRFPRGLSTLLRRPIERSHSVQSGRAGNFFSAGF